MALCGNLRVSYRETRRGTRRFFCGSLTGWANSVGLLFKGVTVRRQKGLAQLPEDYMHSSATYYFTGKQGVYPVITYMELQDIDLTSSSLF